MYFAAFLKARNIPFIGSSKVGKKTYFIFENVDEMRDLKDGYFGGRETVSALGHANEIRTLKRLCYM